MSKAATRKKAVTTGIVPAIRALLSRRRKEDVDGRAFAAPKGLRPLRRVKPRHDEPKPRQPRSRVTRLLMALPAAVLSFLASSAPAFADLKLCNRMSYVVEAAIGIDDKSATATRGWFRIDPAGCRIVVQGTLTADRILLNARALGVYGASPIPQSGNDTLCIAPENFVIAAARQCRTGQTPAPFTQITPTQADDGKAVTSRGWYRIDPGKCLHPDVTGQPKQIFSFAEAVDGENRAIKLKDKPLNWGGAKELCTRESKFEVNEQGDCGTRGLAAIGFAAVDMSGGGKTLRFAIP